ncbi:hypothetical protein BET03_06990 [Thermohalobacter berrensis]|uniref:Putative Flp pilus-assembly TadG-like N-terminal domain-containing protein n=1 Tax=Thermohalobacter berrensis TaxID=99594 RepID=A0A419SUJ5_9FIRM|nr:hypothetical protein BET03_06990 [Thermohalobacter berrensis]
MRNERGSTYIITILAMTAILGFTALVTDVGLLLIKKVNLSNALDASVLAGIQELPSNSDKAIEVVKEYAQKNGVSPENIEVYIQNDNTLLKAYAVDDVNFMFAKILGINQSQVSASSTAIVAPVTAVYDGIRPFVVEQQDFEYGQQVVLKEGAGDGYNGNYGAVALGGTGSNIFRNNVKYGYKGKLKVGDLIDTETGNMSGPTLEGIDFILQVDYSTFDNFSRDSLRLWTIPVVDTLAVDGRKEVKVVGFAEFFVEGAVENNGKAEIIGRFIEFAVNGDISETQSDFGLKGVKLIE